MPKVVVNNRVSFTQIENVTVRDEKLSLKALGLLVYMLSFDYDWDFSLDFFVQHRKDGRAAIRSALQELVDLGYLEIKRGKHKNGSGAKYVYKIFECNNLDYLFERLFKE